MLHPGELNRRLHVVDALVNAPEIKPRWGWHDDHRHLDRTPEYRPAMQQVYSEFIGLIGECNRLNLLDGRCLQLGMGEIDVSHEVWKAMFSGGAVTIDLRVCINALDGRSPGDDTSSRFATTFAGQSAPYSMIFVDAGHLYSDVMQDHLYYWPFVQPGGIMAFHDSAKRPGYEDEIRVWSYLETLERAGTEVTRIGDEVGVAFIRKPL